ncbi:hypothetical protein GALMADRAFT_279092 [Galerina marginata CBS 339.88]|uniref:Uncharacterized protein n=1 Tax=Galerina marginata (strain CBS 339.88) TaxID=685588 RepID=A0A067TEC9_GALM3|nr:hypothetical protein GALMADRAFT_279092 [Galerina marginata CBS 339.88]
MPELVDIAPFTSVIGENVRVFVGRKESSLLLIELETGRIKATLNGECSFIPDGYQDAPLDFDERDRRKPPVSLPTEVYIKRTDYIVSIHRKLKPGQPVPPPQELAFSTYGPINEANHLQTIYRRTNDVTFVQSLANGKVIAFHAPAPDGNPKEPKQEGRRVLWENKFDAPVVAIFDILRSRSPIQQHRRTTPHGRPFVFLQPRPRVHDLFPKTSSSSDPLLGKLDTAYVGLVQDSLFVMSPEHYPFGFGERGGGRHGLGTRQRGRKPLDAPKEEDTDSELDECLANPHAPRCLVGFRPLEDVDGIEDRVERLLDGPKLWRMLGGSSVASVQVLLGLKDRLTGGKKSSLLWRCLETDTSVQVRTDL